MMECYTFSIMHKPTIIGTIRVTYGNCAQLVLANGYKNNGSKTSMMCVLVMDTGQYGEHTFCHEMASGFIQKQ